MNTEDFLEWAFALMVVGVVLCIASTLIALAIITWRAALA